MKLQPLCLRPKFTTPIYDKHESESSNVYIEMNRQASTDK